MVRHLFRIYIHIFMHQFVVFSSGNSWNELKEMKTKLKKKQTNEKKNKRKSLCRNSNVNILYWIYAHATSHASVSPTNLPIKSISSVVFSNSCLMLERVILLKQNRIKKKLKLVKGLKIQKKTFSCNVTIVKYTVNISWPKQTHKIMTYKIFKFSFNIIPL